MDKVDEIAGSKRRCTPRRDRQAGLQFRSSLGEEELLSSRGVSVEVVQNEECIELMRKFIGDNPALWNEDIGV